MTPSQKALATHSSTLAWKIPWMEEPGRLQSMVSLRVGRDWVTSLSLFTFMHWRRKWQPTPMFLPGESRGRGSLVGCHLWGCNRVGHDQCKLAASGASDLLTRQCCCQAGALLHLSEWDLDFMQVLTCEGLWNISSTKKMWFSQCGHQTYYLKSF